jgi:large subunit ribosomal protein L10
MNRAEKTEVIESLHKTFTESGSVILLDFKGVTVPEITELRDKVRESQGGYAVVKNTLALRAAEGTPIDSIKEHFAGPTAIAYTAGDPVALAKTLRDFVKEQEGMEFKVGVLDGSVLTEGQVVELAALPSREELLSKLLFLLNAPLTRLVTALQSPVRNLAVALGQLEGKK